MIGREKNIPVYKNNDLMKRLEKITYDAYHGRHIYY